MCKVSKISTKLHGDTKTACCYVRSVHTQLYAPLICLKESSRKHRNSISCYQNILHIPEEAVKTSCSSSISFLFINIPSF